MVSIFRMLVIISITFLCLSIDSPANCNSLYNYLTHLCENCPTNTSITLDRGFCNCTVPFYQNIQAIGFNAPNSCLQAASTAQIVSLYNINGAYNPTPISCSSNSYPNMNKTACIPCGFGMTYNTTFNKCVCSNSAEYIIGESCFQPSVQPTSSFAEGSLSRQLYNKAQVGCFQFSDHDSCQILLNMCSSNSYVSNSFCDLLNQINASNANIPTFQFQSSYLTQSLSIFASSKPGTNTTTVKNTLDFRLFQYNVYGELVDIKPLTKQILPCPATEQDLIQFQSFGLNLLKRCEPSDKNTVSSNFYDIFVLNSQGNYLCTPIRYPTNNQNLYRRFTWLNTSERSLMTFSSAPPLTVPVLNFTTLTTDLGEMQTESTSVELSLTLLAPFLIFNVAILVVFIINFYKYIKYNPDQTNDPYYVFKAALIFFLMAFKYWGIGLWIFLFGLSTYIFCFFKFQETVYLLLPSITSQWWEYYDPFLALFYAQFAFVLLSFFLLIYDLSVSTDYFMIDWQKQKDLSNFDIKMGQKKKQASVWRKILLVNELYQLTINRIINMEFVVLFSLVFLKGLNWINLSYQIPNTTHLNDDNSSAVINPVLGYFIVTFVIFIIAILQYIIRFLVKVWMPLPYEDFVDLCCICNISLIIFDQALHGYYLHGTNPLGQAQGSLQYIQSVFEKQSRSFGKSRAFQNDDPDKVQIFQVSFPFEIRQTFQMKYKNRYQQKLLGKTINPSVFSKPIPQMMDQNDYKQIQSIHNDMLDSFKYYLEGVKTSQFNVKQRGFISKLFSCPDNVQLIGRLPIFYKDFWHQFTNVLMSGHEILLLIYVINFINVFYIATQNIFLAVFIAMMLTRLLRLISDNVVKRSISKNTLIEDKFFN